jgi:hypothetical protein
MLCFKHDFGLLQCVYIVLWGFRWFMGGCLAKIRLKIVTYKQGNRIASIPLRKLKELASYDKRHWDLKVLDGHVWLILEAF